MDCKADCFQDGAAVRPLASPKRLVWTYFEVEGAPGGTLGRRRFEPCGCGCGNLTADPPASVRHGPA